MQKVGTVPTVPTYVEIMLVESNLCRKYENNCFWSDRSPADPCMKQVSRIQSREKNMRLRSWSMSPEPWYGFIVPELYLMPECYLQEGTVGN